MSKKSSFAPYGVLGSIGGFIGNRATELYIQAPPADKLINALNVPDAIISNPLHFSLAQAPLLVCGGILATASMMYLLRDTREYSPGSEYGDDRFATKREQTLFMDKKNFTNNLILGNGLYKNLYGQKNSEYTRNNNAIVVGGSGAWKTTSYIMTNMAQMNSNYILTDPKGQTIHRVGGLLEKNGYRVLQVDFDTLKNSAHFNCFAYVKDELTLKKVIRTLIDATNADHDKKGEPFWDKAEELLITSLFSYLYYKYRGEGDVQGSGVMPNLSQISELVRCLRRQDPDCESALEILFNDFAKKFGEDNFAYLQWQNFLNNFKDKTADSVLAITITRFILFDLKQVKDFISDDNLEIEKWCEEKTAVFLKIADMDDTFSFLPLMVFLLAFRTLESRIDNEFNGSSPIPIQFLMDEFVNLGKVPDVEKALRVFRSRWMSITLMIQDIFGLKANYKNDWQSFFGNCDTWIYLSGSSEPDTWKWFHDAAGTKTIYRKSRTRNEVRSEPMKQEVISIGKISNLPRQKALVKISSFPMFKINKYNYMKHPQAKYFGNKPSDPYWYEVKPYRDTVDEYLVKMEELNLQPDIKEISWQGA